MDNIEKSLQRIADSLERLELIMIKHLAVRNLSEFWDGLKAFQQQSKENSVDSHAESELTSDRSHIL